MRNYGPEDGSWRLWHQGPVPDRENVVLVHGFRLPLASRRGRCNRQFGDLDALLQRGEPGCNAWQFEYAASPWGTYHRVSTYAARLADAVKTIGELTGNPTCSIVAYSMGGLVARHYIASGGGPTANKLLTLAAPHMGTLRFQPFSLDLKWADRAYPRVAAELRPDSRFLWRLNANVDSSCVDEFAAVGGYSWGRTDGLVELGSSGLVKCNPDGSVAESFYFAGVRRSHLNINRFRHEDDEVFRLVSAFLLGGTEGISDLRPSETPGDYGVPSFLTFSLNDNCRGRKVCPRVVVANGRRRYSPRRVMSQGARTESGARIYTVQLRPDDDGEVRVHYGQDEYAILQICRGQSTIVTRPIGESVIAGGKPAARTPGIRRAPAAYSALPTA
jgi:pimeloyl-ACP methyl ester carboxylesterase